MVVVIMYKKLIIIICSPFTLLLLRGMIEIYDDVIPTKRYCLAYVRYCVRVITSISVYSRGVCCMRT